MTRLLIPFCRIACVLLLAFATGVGAQGIAVPIGGALKHDNSEVWSRLVSLAGGPGARYAVFATASGDPEKSAAAIIATLNRYGAVAEHIPLAPLLRATISAPPPTTPP
jgi:cyanophycinase